MRADIPSAAQPAAPAEDLAGSLARLSAGRDAASVALIEHALRFAERAHHGQRRVSGEPFIAHPLAAAEILHRLDMDAETIAAAILHDVVEDTEVELEVVEEQFGPSVARLVDGVTKISAIEGYGPARSEAEQSGRADGLRKLFIAITEDVRVVLVKLADRLHNLRTLSHLDDARRRRIAQESLEVYAPLASRLGIWQLKWEMEDLAFRCLEPDVYLSIARQLDERRKDRERYIARVIVQLTRELESAEVEAKVSGRPKHIYSIWRKMRATGLDFEQLFDVRAVRILVHGVADCYAALGVVHTLWQHIPKEFDDYITNPKSNRYQSLHTAVIGPEGRPLEVQIRTHEMHAHAELGVAAHWRYKEDAGTASRDRAIEERLKWLRQVLDWRDDPAEAGGFMDRFRAEALEDRVYVLTPQGQVVDLPLGATPLDFAYHIHTEVGNRCRGAKVDGRMIPLSRQLRSGEQVEILTARQGGPSRDWLNPHLGYLRTPRARSKVRLWFRQQDHDKNATAGREVLDRELQRLGIDSPDMDKLLKRFNFVRGDDLLAAIGRGDVSAVQVTRALEYHLPERSDVGERAAPRRSPHPERDRDPLGSGVRVEGVGSLLTAFAGCCRPVPPDPIVGYITRGRGVTVHRQDCANALRLGASERSRFIDVSWSEDTARIYPVQVQIRAWDRKGLLRDITTVVAREKLNVDALTSTTDRGHHVTTVRLTVEVADLAELSRLLDRLLQLPNVMEASRVR